MQDNYTPLNPDSLVIEEVLKKDNNTLLVSILEEIKKTNVLIENLLKEKRTKAANE